MKRKIKITLFLLIVLSASISTNVQAGYQSIYKSSASAYAVKSSKTWVSEVRKLENPGNGMGLAESFDSNTLLATTDANNIDVHMVKNTEWGAMAILSASNYGKQGTGSTRYVQYTDTKKGILATSTGNYYGIYNLTGSNQFVAGVGTSKTYGNYIDSRYFDLYYKSGEYRKGDALKETTTSSGFEWHTTRGGSDLPSWNYASGFYGYRGYYSVFYYKYSGDTSMTYPTRACVVSGEGF